MTPENPSQAEMSPAVGMGEAGRLSGVFFEPKKAFEDIAQRPSFLVPLILSIIAGCIFVALMAQHVGWDQVLKQQMAMNPRGQQAMENLPAEQRDNQMAIQRAVVPYTNYG